MSVQEHSQHTTPAEPSYDGSDQAPRPFSWPGFAGGAAVVLALGIATGQPLTQRQRLDHVGLVLQDTHYQGLRFGQDFDHLYDLPLIEQGTTVTVNSIHAAYSEDSIPLNGTWDTDTRMCLEAASPRAATVLAAVVVGAGHVK